MLYECFKMVKIIDLLENGYNSEYEILSDESFTDEEKSLENDS